MSLVNAVHVLLEVAAGRRNLSPADADELHDAIDAEQAPAAVPEPAPDPTSSGSSPTDGSPEGVNLDAPADA